MRAGPIILPELLVVHYGVTDSLDALVSTQQHQGYGAHVSIDGFWEGERSVCRVVQHIPFNRRASHAGKSAWNGRPRVSDFSVGIEISNPGPIVGGKTVWGKSWPTAETVAAVHKSGLVPSWRHWATYTDQELDLVAHIYALLRQRYPVVEILGHDDVAPGRKFDPGPAFPLDWVRSAVTPGR